MSGLTVPFCYDGGTAVDILDTPSDSPLLDNVALQLRSLASGQGGLAKTLDDVVARLERLDASIQGLGAQVCGHSVLASPDGRARSSKAPYDNNQHTAVADSSSALGLPSETEKGAQHADSSPARVQLGESKNDAIRGGTGDAAQNGDSETDLCLDVDPFSLASIRRRRRSEGNSEENDRDAGHGAVVPKARYGHHEPALDFSRSLHGMRHYTQSDKSDLTCIDSGCIVSHTLKNVNKLRVPTQFRPMVQPSERPYRAPSMTLPQRTCIILVFVDAISMWFKLESAEAQTWQRVLEWFLCTAFTFEFVLRAVLFRRTFVNSAWSLLDGVIILLQWCMLAVDEATIASDETSSLGAVRSLRILRLARYARLVRLLRILSMPETVRKFAPCIAVICRYLLVVVIGNAFLLYIFVLVLTTGAAECTSANLAQGLACSKLQSPSRSLAYLVQVMFHGTLWGELYDDTGNAFVAGMLFVFVLATMLVGANITTAIVVEAVKQSGVHDLDSPQAASDKEKSFRELAATLTRLDIDQNGSLSYPEFELALRDQNFVNCLYTLGLEEADGKELFVLLDREQKGAIDIEDFTHGLLRLKGTPQVKDTLKMQLQNEMFMQLLTGIKRSLDAAVITGRKPPTRRAPQRERRKPTRAQECWSPGTDVDGKGGVIEDAGQRALLLHELEELATLVRMHCGRHAWKGRHSGEALQPNSVSLYDFMHHYVNPVTVPEGVLLSGLPGFSVEAFDNKVGMPIVQLDEQPLPMAEGSVVEVRPEGLVVKVNKGSFVGHDNGYDCNLFIDEQNCGVPQRVQSLRPASYKEIISATPTRPRWFCSHWWGESVIDFVTCCREHSRLRKLDPDHASYWVCAYANRQCELTDCIPDDPEASSFRHAMRQADGVLLILDPTAKPFSRIWCCFELYHGIQDSKQLDIVTTHRGKASIIADLPGETIVNKAHRESSFPIALFAEGLKVRLQDGQATRDSDRLNILSSLQRSALNNSSSPSADAQDELDRAVSEANSTISGRFARAAWLLAIKQGRVKDFDKRHPGTLSLPAVLRADTRTKALSMTFTGSHSLSDKDIEDVAEGFSPTLESISLDCSGCKQITDSSVKAISEGIAPIRALRTLELNFMSCEYLTDASLQVLARKLSDDLPVLNELKLYFALCPRITAVGVSLLAQAVPSRVTILHATFQGTRIDMEFRDRSELLRHFNISTSSAPLGPASSLFRSLERLSITSEAKSQGSRNDFKSQPSNSSM